MKLASVLAACVAAALAQSAFAQSYSWTVFAGTPPPAGSTGGAVNAGSNDGTGQAARFNQPHFLSIDSSNILFVTDTANATIRRITPAGVVSTILGLAGSSVYVDGSAAEARFVAPFGILAGSSNALLITESSSHTIRVVNSALEVRTAGGSTGQAGSVDGVLSNARFNFPSGMAIDGALNTYLTDTGNHTIRRVTPISIVSRVAGVIGQPGSSDGLGTLASFNSPRGLVIDRAGNLFVADTGNHVIRKITPASVVTTFAGLAGSVGSANGTGASARFSSPWGLALDASENLYVTDMGNNTIRKITPTGVVTTIGGTAGAASFAEGSAPNARFAGPIGIAIDSSGSIFVSARDNNVIMKGALDTQPIIATQPQSQQVPSGAQVTFAVTASGGGLAYQWKFNGAAVAGATNATYVIASAQTTASGTYSVDVTNSVGTAASSIATLTVQPPLPPVDASRIANLAIRSQAGTGAQTLIVGVAVGGAGATGVKPVMIRGVGPTLSLFNVGGFLVDPKLELYTGATKLAENDDWNGNPQAADVASQVGAFALPSTTSKDSVLLYNPAVNPGSYSVWITGNGGATGVALAEIYDATPAGTSTPSTPRLINVSARTQVGTGGDILIAGFVITGQGNKTVLIRAVGPTLADFGVGGVLNNPKLELYSGQTKIYENDDWGGAPVFSSAFTSVGAFALPAASRDAVLLVTLAPGSYTAQVSGVDNTTGVALVEVYDVPSP